MNWNEKSAQGLLRIVRIERHRIRVYEDRLAISRLDDACMSWEELQTVKQMIWGNRVCIEVYPAEHDVVNLRNTRHLWWSPSIEVVVTCKCRHAEFNNAN